MPAKFVLYDNGSIETTQEIAIANLRKPDSKPMAFFWDDKGDFYKASKGKVLITTTPIDPPDVLMNSAKPVKVGVEMLLPKIPLHLFTQILSFFRDICDETEEEVFARIYYDTEEANYFIYVPKQKISKCNVRYEIDDERFQDETRYLFVMDVHSHNTMGAFFSGTDDRDETTNGRLYGVIGQLNKEVAAFKVRTYLNPNHIETDFFTVFEKPEEAKVSCNTPYGTFNYEVPDEALIPAILSSKVDYPAEWKDQIVKEVYTPATHVGAQMTFGDSFAGLGYEYNDIASFHKHSKTTPSKKKNNGCFRPKGQLSITGWEDDIDDAETYEFEEMTINPGDLSEEEMYELAAEVAEKVAEVFDDNVSSTSNEMFNQLVAEALLEKFGIDLTTEGLH